MPGELEKIRVWFRDYKVRPFMRFRGNAADCAAGACLVARHTDVTCPRLPARLHSVMPHTTSTNEPPSSLAIQTKALGHLETHDPRRSSDCVCDAQTPDGKPQNSYGFNDECLNREFTLGVISETHEFYTKLVSGERENTEGLALK